MSAPLLSLEAVGVRQQSDWLFTDVDIHIRARERLALVGRNGAGKSTLMRLLSGAQEPDAGGRVLVPGAHVVHLEQNPDLSAFASLADYVVSADDGHAGAEFHVVEALAHDLGVDLERSAASASGGERRRAALARALALAPDVLLLDEPTNHLDLAAIEWLENKLDGIRCAVVIISHDRRFLSRLTRQTLWLERGTVRRKEIGFEGFEVWAEQVFEEEAKNADKLDTKLKQELHWLQRGVTARRKRNQGRLRKLGDMRAERRAMTGPQTTAKLALADNAAQKSKLVIDAKDIAISFNGRQIIKPVSLRIARGERIGIVGANGAGKTTLLKMLIGDMACDSGSIRRAKILDRVSIDQQRKDMKPGLSVKDVLCEGNDWIMVRGEKKHIAGYLKDYLFDPKIAEVPVETLSGGEQARVLMAREFAKPSNLLVLDEPTNDLDLETMDLLQEVIADYDGTVLIVSHDRDFLDRTVTTTYGLDGSGSVDVVVGGYSDWATKRDANRRAREKATKPVIKASVLKPAVENTGATQKLSFKEVHELKDLPGEIEKLEARIASLDAKVSDPGLYARDANAYTDFSTALANFRDVLEAKQMRWLELEIKNEG
jgi:ABC transport system ATP-binding/permease protein